MYIRLAEVKDIPMMLAIEEKNFKERAFSRRQFFHYVNKEHTYVMAYPEDDEVTGYCVVFIRAKSNIARINVISVNPRLTGQGIGNRLLNFVEYVYAKTHDQMQLEVNSTNEGAIRLYERRGYQIVDFLDDYYGPNTVGIKMIKRLK